MQDLGVQLVLDVGANVGQYGQDIRVWNYAGPILSFEPLSSAFAQLQRATEKAPPWKAIHTAVGATPGTATINISANSMSSSLLQMRDRHRTAAPESRFVDSETVNIITLNSLRGNQVDPNQRLWLKIDVQGFEKAVLEGAAQILPQVVGIECEMSIVPLYDNEPLMEEMIALIARLGFRLAQTTEAFYETKTSRTLQLNGIFLRDANG